jgi:hypothetical protein
MSTTLNSGGTSVPNVAAGASKMGAGRLIFRLIRWVTYAAAVITLLMVFHTVPPPAIATSPQAAARFDEKLQSAEQSAARGESATLRLDQTELNSYLVTHLELSGNAPHSNGPSSASTPATEANPAGIPSFSGTSAQQIEQVRSSVKDVKVELLRDSLRAYVVFDFHGKDMTLQLEGKPSGSNGYLRFEPVSGQIGSFPIPLSSLQSALQKMMDSPENREKLKLPEQISDLRIENGELVVAYR